MKKYFIYGIITILIGVLFAFFVLNNNVFYAKESNYVYAFQIGAFKEFDNADNTIKKNGGILVHDNGLYKVYIGIYKNTDVINKMLVYFENKGINVYLKSIIVKDNFYNMIDNYEELIRKSNDEMVYIKATEGILNLYSEGL